MSCLWRKLADNSLTGRQSFHLVLLYLLNFCRTCNYCPLKVFQISNLRSHTTTMNLATECIRLTLEAENYSQKQHVEKGGTMCRSKIAGQVQAEGTRRQEEDGATQDQKSLGGAGELVLTTEVGTALLALCHIQC